MEEKKFKKPQKYIIAYCIYEIAYVFFWLIISRLHSYDYGKYFFVYAISTMIAAGWMGYIAYRVLVKKDTDINIVAVFSNALMLYIVSEYCM